MGKRVCIAYANGCPRTEVLVGIYHNYFIANGWEITNRIEKAELILISGCGFSEEAEMHSLKYISLAMRKRKDQSVKIAVFGCLSGISGEMLWNKFNVIPLIHSEPQLLDRMINADVSLAQIKEANFLDNFMEKSKSAFSRFERLLAKSNAKKQFIWHLLINLIIGKLINPSEVYSKNLFNVRVATGCTSECSYCAIKKAKGRIISKNFTEIMTEIKSGLSQGYSLIRLIGEDVGAYGHDQSLTIVELLHEIFNLKGDFKLLISDFHPQWLIKYFRELSVLFIKNKDKIGYLGFPAQSGSDKILTLMKREYKAADLVKCFIDLQRYLPKNLIRTHIMIGFPGETEKDFEETLQFIRTVQVPFIATYLYSDRPGTEASSLTGKVTEFTKYKRLLRFCKLYHNIQKKIDNN